MQAEQASRQGGMDREVPTLLKMISGARYSGVPHKVQVRPFTRLAKPKSVTCRHKNELLPGSGEGQGRSSPRPPGSAPCPSWWAPGCSPAGQ